MYIMNQFVAYMTMENGEGSTRPVVSIAAVQSWKVMEGPKDALENKYK